MRTFDRQYIQYYQYETIRHHQAKIKRYASTFPHGQQKMIE